MIRLDIASTQWLAQGGTGSRLPNARTVVIRNRDGHTMHSKGRPYLYAYAGDDPAVGERVECDTPIITGTFVRSEIIESDPSRVRLVAWTLDIEAKP